MSYPYFENWKNWENSGRMAESSRAPIYPPHTGKTRIISQTVALLCLKRSKYIKGVVG